MTTTSAPAATREVQPSDERTPQIRARGRVLRQLPADHTVEGRARVGCAGSRGSGTSAGCPNLLHDPTCPVAEVGEQTQGGRARGHGRRHCRSSCKARSQRPVRVPASLVVVIAAALRGRPLRGTRGSSAASRRAAAAGAGASIAAPCPSRTSPATGRPGFNASSAARSRAACSESSVSGCRRSPRCCIAVSRDAEAQPRHFDADYVGGDELPDRATNASWFRVLDHRRHRRNTAMPGTLESPVLVVEDIVGRACRPHRPWRRRRRGVPLTPAACFTTRHRGTRVGEHLTEMLSMGSL